MIVTTVTLKRRDFKHVRTGRQRLVWGWLLLVSLCVARGQGTVLYENDFQKAEVGKVPEDMMVLDGNFSVKAEGTNKFLELPGAPLDSFAVQFGPAETNSLSLS